MRIANNISALKAMNILNSNNSALQKTIRALSSGLRINSAADDASGLAISEKMRSQIGGLDRAIHNTQDGISLLQTAEGALSETTSMLQRMRELAVQAANDTLTQQDRGYIQVEIDQLKDEINRTARTTQFNKKKILNGEAGALWSSSDSGVKALIHGAIGGTDQFGQYVSAEGNYDLEIRVEEQGRGQVQKTKIFAIEYPEPVEREFHINLNTGEDTYGATSGDGWYFSGGALHITGDGKYSIFGETAGGAQIATRNYIHVEKGVKATIFLKDVYIDASQYAIYLEKADVDLYLDPGDYDNVNTLIGGSGHHCSAIECGEGAKLRISSIKGDFETDGKLYAKGSVHSAGIGGACSGAGNGIQDAGEITIYGGTVEAEGGLYGAGIGGAWYGNGGNITIYGGDVTAKGGDGDGTYGGGAGIGAGNSMSRSSQQNTGTINIVGGSLKVEGGHLYSPDNYDSNPHPPEVTLYSDITTRTYPAGDEHTGAAIGGGEGFTSGQITINNSVRSSINIVGGYIDNASGNTASIGCGKYSQTSNVTYQDMELPEPREVPDYPTRIVEDLKSPAAYELHEIQQFYDENGKFLLDDPQTLTITQGDGKTASFTVYGRDTMYDLAAKINSAIGEGLGQNKYLSPNHLTYVRNDNFCTIADGTEQSSESVWFGKEEITDQATLLIRSVVAGKEGELVFSGSEELLNALGLNTIMSSRETTYSTTVKNSHTGETLIQDLKTTGSKIHGLLHPNVDVEFDSMCATVAAWDDDDKTYRLVSTGTFTTTLHLADNSMKLQTGANEGECFMVDLGDMSADALGVSKVNVSTHETAGRAITLIDRAIDIVNTQRAKIGATENTLEHTMSRLTIASENLTQAESRIRDADMAKMMLAFTKYQIMTQAGMSMLAQANQFPQQVMSLMR